MKKAAVSSILVVAMLLAVAVIAEAQQPAKVPRIGFLRTPPAASGPRRRHFAKGCASSAISKERISPSSTDMRRES